MNWQNVELGHFLKYSELPSLCWVRKVQLATKFPGEFHKTKSNIYVVNETQIWYSLRFSWDVVVFFEINANSVQEEVLVRYCTFLRDIEMELKCDTVNIYGRPWVSIVEN